MKCCEKYAAALSAFADGELNGPEREELLAHIEHCESCREYLSELMVLRAVFEEMPELQAPQGFAEKVLDRMHEEERAGRRHRRAIPRVLAACAALVVISAAALRFALPGMGAKDDSTACDDNGAADTASAPTADIAPDESDDTYTSYTYSAVQKDGAQYSPGDTPLRGYDSSANSPESSPQDAMQNEVYPTVRLSGSAIEDFLVERGMAVYSENEESVSFLVTPEVARELGAALVTNEDAAAALSQADEILIVEVAKAQSAEQSEAEPPAGDGEAAAPEEEEVSR